MKKLYFILSCVFITYYCHSQIIPWAVNSENTIIQGICEEIDDSATWLYIAADAEITAIDFWDTYMEDMGLSEDDEMVLFDTLHDELGYIHYWYKQFYKGVEVEGMMYALHENDNGELYLAHGKLLENIDIIKDPFIQEEDALNIVLDSIDSDSAYAWENEEWEQDIRLKEDDSNATYYPEGKLIIARDTGDFDLLDHAFYKLAWMFTIVFADTLPALNFFVNGSGIFRIDTLSELNACNGTTGQFTALVYGQQNDLALRSINNNYELTDCSRNIDTRVHTLYKPFSFLNKISYNSNNWGSYNEIATTGHWCVQQAYDYFKTNFNHYGWDGRNLKKIQVRVEYKTNPNSNWEQAQYNSVTQELQFGHMNNNNKPMISLDIVGHEYTHAVEFMATKLSYYSNLKHYRLNSDAIMESISDIYGTLIEGEYYNDLDWACGIDDAYGTGYYIKYFRDLQYPDEDNPILGEQWIKMAKYVNQTGKWPDGKGKWDMYAASGPHSYWFYLLTEGGSCRNINITGIGKEKSQKILFHAMRYYFTSNTTYKDARNAETQAAKDIYGGCSEEYFETWRAWSAVNVYNEPQNWCVTISGPSNVCPDNNITLTAKSNCNATFTWTGIPQEFTYSISGTNNKYLNITDFGNVSDATLGVEADFSSIPNAYATKQIHVDEFYCPHIIINSGKDDNNNSNNIEVKYVNIDRKIIINFKNNNSNCNFYLYNSCGQILENKKIDCLTNINLSDYSSGIYFINVISDSQNIFKKIVIL